MTAPVVDDPIAWCVATELKRCFCEQLAEVSAPVVCCCLMPGAQVAWDSCDPGQAWVRVASIYQVGHTFPQPARPEDLGPCGGIGGWAVTLELGAVRCLPQPDLNGVLPTCEDYSEAARLVLADAHAMRRAVLCCDWRDACDLGEAGMVVGNWMPTGPQGACAGGVMSVTVEVHACICDPTDGGTP